MQFHDGEGLTIVVTMSDIVLVHGTTQSAEGYGPLIAALKQRGQRSLAVRVPSGAAATAEEYAGLLATQVPDDFDSPVVVAHSASGLLLPALARRIRASQQVWLAAVVADYAGGRSFLQEFQRDPLAVVNPE